jgi:DNA-binding MarR family transcriptional regulator
MVEPYLSEFLTPSKRYRRFSLLLAIKKDPHVTQKQLGRETCLSSAMVNNYIKALSKEGLLTVSGKSNRAMTYYLTSAGREYVSENFLLFSSEIVQFYASVRREIVELLTECYASGIRTIVLYGASDTAEVVYSAVQKTELVVTGVVDNDPAKQGTMFFGSVIQSPSRINEIRPDALVVTSFARQKEILGEIEGTLDEHIQIKVISRI